MVKKLIACIFTVCCVMPSAYAGAVEQVSTQSSHDYLMLGLPDTEKNSSEDNNSDEMPIMYLAASDEKLSSSMQSSDDNEAASNYKDRMFTGNKIHKYLGIGSVGAALLTILMPKEEDGPHEYFAKTSAVLGVGAVATGLGFHYEDISMSGGFKDPDNLHALWAGLGAVGLGMAASTGPDAPHAAYGALGTISMMIGIKYTW